MKIGIIQIQKLKRHKCENKKCKTIELQEKDKPQSGWRGGDGDKPEVH